MTTAHKYTGQIVFRPIDNSYEWRLILRAYNTSPTPLAHGREDSETRAVVALKTAYKSYRHADTFGVKTFTEEELQK